MFRYINVPWLEIHGFNHLTIPAAVTRGVVSNTRIL